MEEGIGEGESHGKRIGVRKFMRGRVVDGGEDLKMERVVEKGKSGEGESQGYRLGLREGESSPRRIGESLVEVGNGE